VSGERVVELRLGCHPEAAVSGAVLLQSEESGVLLFNAMSNELNADGCYEPLGTAVVEFERLHQTRFGGPNDEGRPEHPLDGKGLSEMSYAICEVLESSWAREEAARREAGARRIHRDLFEQFYKGQSFVQRHFLFLFHDSTLECLADDVRVTLSKDPFSTIVDRFVKRMAGG
jgi:hypothetical protein